MSSMMSVRLAILFIGLWNISLGENCLDGCIELVAVLDESTSVRTAEFNTIKQFVKEIIDSFTQFGDSGLRVSVVTFSSIVRNKFYLNDYEQKDDIKTAIDGIVKISGNTATGDVLKYIRENTFDEMNGARDECIKIVIILVDGVRNTGIRIGREASKLKSMGVNIFAVGLGTSTSLDNQLTLIASNYEYAFDLNSFANLTGQTALILNTICDIKTKQKTCLTCADIVFLLDESGSVSNNEFVRLIDFMIAVVTSFHTFGLPYGVRIGLTSFGTHPTDEFHLNTYNFKTDIMNHFLQLNSAGGNTGTGDALYQIRNTHFNSTYDRDCSKILIVLFDGDTNTGRPVAPEAEALRNEGVHIFAIGIEGVSIAELEKIASPSTTSITYSFRLSNFNELQLNVDMVAKEVCDVAGPPPILHRKRCRRHRRGRK